MSKSDSRPHTGSKGKEDQDKLLRIGKETKSERFLGQEELPPEVERDLIELSNKAFEKEYQVDSTAPGETLVQAADVFDLPNMSDERLDALQSGLAQMSSERVMGIQERIMRPASPDTSALAQAREHVLELLVGPVDVSKQDGELEAGREVELMSALESLKVVREEGEVEQRPAEDPSGL